MHETLVMLVLLAPQYCFVEVNEARKELFTHTKKISHQLEQHIKEELNGDYTSRSSKFML